MFIEQTNKLVATILLSVALISCFSNINPHLHSHLIEQWKTIKAAIHCKTIEQLSVNHFSKLCSLGLIVLSINLYLSRGLRRVLIVSLLCLILIYFVKQRFVDGLSFEFLFILINLSTFFFALIFNDCLDLEQRSVELDD